MLVFEERGKNRVSGEKPLVERNRTNNKLNSHMTPSPEIEPGSHHGGHGRRGEHFHRCAILSNKNYYRELELEHVWINPYTEDKNDCTPTSTLYPLDKVMNSLNNWDQDYR